MGTLEIIDAGARPSVDAAFDAGLSEFCVRHGIDVLPPAVLGDEQKLVKLVTVRDEAGVLIGGGRVHQRHAERGFPAQWSLRHFAELREHVRGLAASDTAEIAGVWTTASAQNGGYARLVTHACLASARVLGKKVAFTVSHDRFDPVLRAVGMTPVVGLAAVPFPTPSYSSRIYACELGALKGATKVDRDVVATIVDCLGGAPMPMPIHELASIEQGCPSWTVKRRTNKTRAAG